MSNHMDFFQFYSPYHCIIIRATVEHHNVQYLAPVNIRTRYKRTSVHLIPQSFVWIGVKRDLLLVCTLVLGVKRVRLLRLDGIKRLVKRPLFVFGYILYVFLLIALACATQSFPVSLTYKNYFVGKTGNSWRCFLKNNIHVYTYKFMRWRLQRQYVRFKVQCLLSNV